MVRFVLQSLSADRPRPSAVRIWRRKLKIVCLRAQALLKRELVRVCFKDTTKRCADIMEVKT